MRKIPKIKVLWVREIVMDKYISHAWKLLMDKLGLSERYKRYKIGVVVGRHMRYGEILANDELDAWHSSALMAVDKWKLLNGMARYDRKK